MRRWLSIVVLAVGVLFLRSGTATTTYADSDEAGQDSYEHALQAKAPAIQSYEQLMVEFPSDRSGHKQKTAVILRQNVTVTGPGKLTQPLSLSQHLPKGVVMGKTEDKRVSRTANEEGSIVNLTFSPVAESTPPSESKPTQTATVASGTAGAGEEHSCGSGCCGSSAATASGSSTGAKTQGASTATAKAKIASSATASGSSTGGCGSGGGCGCGSGASGSAVPPATRINYQVTLPEQFPPDRWAKVWVVASPNRLVVNRKNLVTLTAYLKVREGQSSGSGFFLPKIKGAEIAIRLTSPGTSVREVPQGMILQTLSQKPEQKFEVLLEVTPHHASSLDLHRVFMSQVSLPEPLFPLEVVGNSDSKTTIKSHGTVTYVSSLSIPIQREGIKSTEGGGRGTRGLN